MTTLSSGAAYAGTGALYSPLKNRADNWNLRMQLEAANIALDILTDPSTLDVCEDHAYTAVLGGYHVATDTWKSDLYRKMESAKNSDQKDLRDVAVEVGARAEQILQQHYGEELARKVDDFAKAHFNAREADGRVSSKRHGYFITHQMGKALDVLHQYRLPVQLTP